MKKSFFFAAAAAALALSQTAGAQTNIQTFYDFGRGYATTTLEMFKGDSWGNTFFFVDHYYATADQRADQGCASAINGSYFEIERNINFWQDSALGALSAMVEYDGSTWGAGIFCVGASYFLHSDDFKNTYTLALLYDQHIGYGSANVPVKFSGVWGMQDLLGVKGLRCLRIRPHLRHPCCPAQLRSQRYQVLHPYRATALVQCRPALRLREPAHRW